MHTHTYICSALQVRADIWAFWERMEGEGQFAPILDELATAEAAGFKWRYP